MVIDELIVRSYFGPRDSINHVIIDARTKTNASLSKAKNGGTELDLSYGSNVKVFTSNIESCSFIQDCHIKFMDGKVAEVVVEVWL